MTFIKVSPQMRGIKVDELLQKLTLHGIDYIRNFDLSELRRSKTMLIQTFKNRFLIAMPTLNDPYFHQTVILLFEHSDKGAMGLIINKPLDISLGEILQHLNIPLTDSQLDKDKVMLGGPVASEQGFIIHTHPELCPGDIIDEDNKITVSASKEVLQNIVENQPDKILVCLGYAMWKKDQLEQELADNAWMLSDVDPRILFNIPYKDRWKAAAKLVGVDFDRLSSDVGHG